MKTNCPHCQGELYVCSNFSGFITRAEQDELERQKTLEEEAKTIFYSIYKEAGSNRPDFILSATTYITIVTGGITVCSLFLLTYLEKEKILLNINDYLISVTLYSFICFMACPAIGLICLAVNSFVSSRSRKQLIEERSKDRPDLKERLIRLNRDYRWH